MSKINGKNNPLADTGEVQYDGKEKRGDSET